MTAFIERGLVHINVPIKTFVPVLVKVATALNIFDCEEGIGADDMPYVRYRIACLFNCYCNLCTRMCLCICCLTATHRMQWRYDPDYERCYLGYLDSKPHALGSILSVPMCPETTMNSC